MSPPIRCRGGPERARKHGITGGGIRPPEGPRGKYTGGAASAIQHRAHHRRPCAAEGPAPKASRRGALGNEESSGGDSRFHRRERRRRRPDGPSRCCDLPAAGTQVDSNTHFALPLRAHHQIKACVPARRGRRCRDAAAADAPPSARVDGGDRPTTPYLNLMTNATGPGQGAASARPIDMRG